MTTSLSRAIADINVVQNGNGVKIVTSSVDDSSPSYLALLAAKTVARGEANSPVVAVLAGS